jgi:hypothetical protein
MQDHLRAERASEPAAPKPAEALPPSVDSVITRAAIHPAIGIARIGDSLSDYYIGPEVTDPAPASPGFYRDAAGALKRQAALFRVYGYNAAGEVVRELTADSADIVWTAQLANRKAEWYQFQMALDIPEAAGQEMARRNPAVSPADRHTLAIDPGPRSIAGKSSSGGPEHAFDTGKFKDVVVPLGEIRTDPSGRLLVLGGHGKSASPSGAPIYRDADPNSFNNADDWYDDISDGPVTAAASIDGRSIPVDHAWVVVAPPNYGTETIGWRTMYDLLTDLYVGSGWLPMPQTVSFTNDVFPFLRRLSNLQWVNKAFAALFGQGGPMNFDDSAFVARLAEAPAPAERNTPADLWAELRRAIFNAFRPFDSPVLENRLWPWIYGDAYGTTDSTAPGNALALPSVQQEMMQRWANGDFIGDWPAAPPPKTLDAVKLAEQPAMLDKAALHFCLADAFHPGCEMTWPLRHASMFEKPFRFRLRPAGEPEPDYGANLTPSIALQPGGPLYDQMAGSISRWMALPWQGDTAFCRSNYPPSFDPYVPTFWPARVPNQVLTEEDYGVVMNLGLPREVRLAAFNNRAFWTRGLPRDIVEAMLQMVAHFADMGVVEAREGIPFDPDFPATIYVESVPTHRVEALRALAAARPAAGPPTQAQLAGWEDEAHRDAATRARTQGRYKRR